jgi:hypothetical protein
MEGAGAVKFFARSIEKNNIIYTHYLGDADSSSFKEVVKSDPYKDYGITPEKLECVAHVQKRMGTRLQNLVKSYKGTLTPLGGKNKLTENVINSMQNYYGLAIRSNTNNIYAMKKAIWAILFHCTGYSNKEFCHCFCPRTEISWCQYQYDKSLNTSKYKEHINLPIWISNLLKPVFTDLSNEELLLKCVHGQTQNTNESLNGLVWSRCPKNIFVCKQTFEMSINSAILHYNDGTEGVKNALLLFGLSGIVTNSKSYEHNISRVKSMEKKSSENVKNRRKSLRAIKKKIL